jgi:DNA repair protein RecO (recombination protein O)
MEETYTTEAIILNRQPFREYDSRVIAYSRDRGKLELVARGAKKISSKLAGHLEPLSLSKIMVVRGRQFDYIGGAAMEKGFVRLKSDLACIKPAGRAVEATDKLIKSGIEDKNIFNLLLSLLETYDNLRKAPADPEILYYFYVLKLLSLLGYRPNLTHCLDCHQEITVAKNRFDPARGGIICSACPVREDGHSLTISLNNVKLMQFVISHGLSDTAELKLANSVKNEIKKIISSFTQYNVNFEI